MSTHRVPHAHIEDAYVQIETGTSRSAVRQGVRTLLTEVRQRFPGRSVELRVPPYAAVQIAPPHRAPAPVHRRGTPGSVVELDAATLAQLCRGDATWSEARTRSSVSLKGEHSDLSAVFPLVE